MKDCFGRRRTVKEVREEFEQLWNRMDSKAKEEGYPSWLYKLIFHKEGSTKDPEFKMFETPE